MILLAFLIALLVASLGKLFFSINRFESINHIEKRQKNSNRQFDEFTFYDSKRLFVK